MQKHDLYTNLKKCWFHENEVRFLGSAVSTQDIRMEEERIEAVKDWPEPQSNRDIQVFLGFANFYRRFIKSFGKIAAPFTSILQTTGNNDLSTQADQNEKNQDKPDGVGGASGERVDRSIKNLSTVAKSAKFKKLKLTKLKKSDLIKAQNFIRANSSRIDFLTFEAKKTFIHP